MTPATIITIAGALPIVVLIGWLVYKTRVDGGV